MEYKYKGIIINVPFKIIDVLDFKYKEEVSEHTTAYIECLVDNDCIIEDSMKLNSKSRITFSELHRYHKEILPFFIGKILKWEIGNKNDIKILKLDLVALTFDYDIKKISRTFINLNNTYTDVFNKIYTEKEETPFFDSIKKGEFLLNNTKISNMLLQYEETNWEFSKRLATHFNTFLFCDTTAEYGRFYIGLPKIDYGLVLEKKDFVTNRDNNIFEKLKSRLEETHIEDIIYWEVNDKKRLYLGEKINFNTLNCIVLKVEINLEKDDLMYTYILQREYSVLTEVKYNKIIYGMSIPATVKERNGNTIKVHFELDKEYTKNSTDKNFVYNIESADFFCMPEEESMVHIHFPTINEGDAYATHAIRIAKESEKYNKRAQIPSHKSLSNVDGAEMKMTDEDISFSPNDDKSVLLQLNRDGVIELTGENINIGCFNDFKIGQHPTEGMKKEDIEKLIVPKTVNIYAKTKVSLIRGYVDMNTINALPESVRNIPLFINQTIKITEDKTAFTGLNIYKIAEASSVSSYKDEVAKLTKNDDILLKNAKSYTEKKLLETKNDAKLNFNKNIYSTIISDVERFAELNFMYNFINRLTDKQNQMNFIENCIFSASETLGNKIIYLPESFINILGLSSVSFDYLSRYDNALNGNIEFSPDDKKSSNNFLTDRLFNVLSESNDLVGDLNIDEDTFNELITNMHYQFPDLTDEMYDALSNSVYAYFNQPSVLTPSQNEIIKKENMINSYKYAISGVENEIRHGDNVEELENIKESLENSIIGLENEIKELEKNIESESQLYIKGEIQYENKFMDNVKQFNQEKHDESKDTFSSAELYKLNEAKEQMLDLIQEGVYYSEKEIYTLFEKIDNIEKHYKIDFESTFIESGEAQKDFIKAEKSYKRNLDFLQSEKDYRNQDFDLARENLENGTYYYGEEDTKLEIERINEQQKEFNYTINESIKDLKDDYNSKNAKHFSDLANSDLNLFLMLNDANKTNHIDIDKVKMINSQGMISYGKSMKSL